MSDLSLFATVPRGLESLLAGELRALGAAHVKQVRAGVAFSGSLETAYRTCLWSRVAGRVLLPVVNGTAADGDDLYKTAQSRRLVSPPRGGRHAGGRLHRRQRQDPGHALRRGAHQGRDRRPVPRLHRRSAAVGGRPRTRRARQRAPREHARGHLDRPERPEPAPARLPGGQGTGGGAAQGEPGRRLAPLRGLAERGRRRRQPARPAVRVGHPADRGGADGGRRRARPAARGGREHAGRGAGLRLPALARSRRRALGRADRRGARAPRRRHEAPRGSAAGRRHPRFGQRPARREGRPRLRQTSGAARPGGDRARPAGVGRRAHRAWPARHQRPVRRAARRRRRGRLPAARRAPPGGLPGVERRRPRRRPATAQGHRPRAQARDRPAQRPARMRTRLLRGRRGAHRCGRAAHRAGRGAVVLAQGAAAGRDGRPNHGRRDAGRRRAGNRARSSHRPAASARRRRRIPGQPAAQEPAPAGQAPATRGASPATGSTTPTFPSTTSSSTSTASGYTSRSTRRRPRSTSARPSGAWPRRSRSSAPSSRCHRSAWCSRSAAGSAEWRSTNGAATPASTSR